MRTFRIHASGHACRECRNAEGKITSMHGSPRLEPVRGQDFPFGQPIDSAVLRCRSGGFFTRGEARRSVVRRGGTGTAAWSGSDRVPDHHGQIRRWYRCPGVCAVEATARGRTVLHGQMVRTCLVCKTCRCRTEPNEGNRNPQRILCGESRDRWEPSRQRHAVGQTERQTPAEATV